MLSTSLQRIIYVDDEPHIRTLVQISLEKIGNFTTCICASGAEAISVGLDFAPDLILLDVMMPELDGPGTLNGLRRLPGLSKVPVVFLTAKANPAERLRLIELGAVGVITKPFPPLELPDRIRAVWSDTVTGAASLAAGAPSNAARLNA
jgi:two-component system OmpR family response regulator